jgi:4-hydroxy-tetrahydrodipicolinate reductase
MTIKVMHFGLGPIGAAVARQVATRKGLRIVGGIDIDIAKVDRDIGDVIGIGKRLHARVWSDAMMALKKTKPDVVVLCTSSSLRSVLPQIEVILKARIPIVSTTEELAYPTPSSRSLVKKIDTLAKSVGAAVLGTGVNPGFVMDTLPIALTGACERVDAIHVYRIQDARSRRLPFQQKIGAGLTVKQFKRRVVDGSVRHVGLTESIQMIADALGWRLSNITDKIEPKTAQARVDSEWITVEPGYVSGLIQDGVGYVDGKPLITLHMEAYLGAPETYDAIVIDGSPPLNVRVIGGTHGDIATASIVVNSIPKILAAAPGYRTMKDLPIPSFFRGS